MDTPEKMRQVIEEEIQTNIGYEDVNYNFALDKLWVVLFQTTTALRILAGKIRTDHMPDKDFTHLLILNNCLVDSHAGYQSMRQGFHRAAAITFRGMLENLALVVACKADETDEIFRMYCADKYHIPNAVNRAKIHFPEIGKLYGILTNTFTHEPYKLIGRAFVLDGTAARLMLVPPLSRQDSNIHFLLILKLSMLVQTLGEVIEWTFANNTDPIVFWDLIDKKTIIRKKDNPSLIAIKEISELYSSLSSQNSFPNNLKPS